MAHRKFAVLANKESLTCFVNIQCCLRVEHVGYKHMMLTVPSPGCKHCENTLQLGSHFGRNLTVLSLTCEHEVISLSQSTFSLKISLGLSIHIAQRCFKTVHVHKFPLIVNGWQGFHCQFSMKGPSFYFSWVWAPLLI